MNWGVFGLSFSGEDALVVVLRLLCGPSEVRVPAALPSLLLDDDPFGLLGGRAKSGVLDRLASGGPLGAHHLVVLRLHAVVVALFQTLRFDEQGVSGLRARADSRLVDDFDRFSSEDPSFPGPLVLIRLSGHPSSGYDSASVDCLGVLVQILVSALDGVEVVSGDTSVVLQPRVFDGLLAAGLLGLGLVRPVLDHVVSGRVVLKPETASVVVDGAVHRVPRVGGLVPTVHHRP